MPDQPDSGAFRAPRKTLTDSCAVAPDPVFTDTKDSMKRSTHRFAVIRSLFCAIAVLAGSGLLSACDNDEAPETVSIKGHLTYRQSAPLPEKANARVSLIQVAETQTGAEPQEGAEAENSGRRIVAEQTLHNLDAKPIAFDLQVGRALLSDAGRYVLKAEINNAEGQAQWRTTEPFLIKPAQVDQEIELLLVPTTENMAVLSFTDFVCEDGFAFAVATQSERAVLRLGDRTIQLPSVRSASGAKYSGDQNVYWSKGSQVLVQIDGQEHPGCLPETAKTTKETTAPSGAAGKISDDGQSTPEKTEKAQDPARQPEEQAQQPSQS